MSHPGATRLLAAALAAAALGCGPADRPASPAGEAAEGASAPAPRSVTDDAGRTVVAPSAPRRIVSLIPAVTEILIALGASDRLIARTDYDDAPELASLPSVGEGLTPNLEWLVANRPDLVVGWTDGTARAVLRRLGELGVPVYSADIQSLADIDSTVARMGRLLGTEGRANALIERTGAGLDQVRRAVSGLPRPRVAYVLSVDPPITTGPGSYLHEVIELAGGENVFADAETTWPMVSLEAVVARNPDLLLVPVGEEGFADPARLSALPGWSGLEAVRSGRVHGVDANLFHRPGPHVVEIARRLVEIYFPGLDPAAARGGRPGVAGVVRDDAPAAPADAGPGPALAHSVPAAGTARP